MTSPKRSDVCSNTVELQQKEVHMSEEDLELLITLDDPEDLEKEDAFHDLKADNTVAPRPGQPLPTRRRHDQRTEVIVGNDSSKLAD
jgi:hypothetical protein